MGRTDSSATEGTTKRKLVFVLTIEDASEVTFFEDLGCEPGLCSLGTTAELDSAHVEIDSIEQSHSYNGYLTHCSFL